jgi:hypothetical protein
MTCSWCLRIPISPVTGVRRQAFRALCGVGDAKDIVVMTQAEFERKRHVVCSLAAGVAREGRLLYAA